MTFKWNDYRKAVVFAQNFVQKPAFDMISFMFEHFSNREEDGFEEAWELFMQDVIIMLEAKENQTKEKMKQIYLSISNEALEQIEAISNNQGHSTQEIVKKTNEINQLRADLITYNRTIQTVKEYARPNWLKRMLKG